ncbi:MAG: Rrf2 family transcriptional regulator [Clostridia bacterium]|nr:Rrf2 family transcriptional regulator [Clostridia bacterium]
MKISTRGRYALRVMIDLAENYNGTYIPLKEIVERQEISQKYLEGIMTDLSKKHLVDALHGKGGGYKLTKEPQDYTVKEILVCTEGSLEPIACLEEGAAPCPREAECRTIKMWQGFSKLVNDYFEGISLQDLTKIKPEDNYVI